jgi:hypothetical protein
LGGLIGGCGSDGDDTATAGAAVTSAPPVVSSQAAVGPTAQQVVDAFDRAGLPVPNPRDNSGNCKTSGCVQLVTTDAVSVYTWPTEAAAQHQVDVAAGEAHRRGLVVLSYAAARTPAEDRPRYEAELAKLG